MIVLIFYLFLWLKSRCFSKDWEVTEYGVCELIDILSEIPDTTICLSQQDNEMVISMPKRGMLTGSKWSLSVVVLTWHHARDAPFSTLSMVPEDSMESAV